MRITKFPQSCLLVDKGDGALLVDPGNVAMVGFGDQLLRHASAVVLTHAHADHLDPDSIDALRSSGLRTHGNSDVAQTVGGTTVEVIADGDQFTSCGFKITAHDLAHFPMVDGSNGPPNLGFELDGRFLHPGDAIELPDHVRPSILALPIAGPSVSFRDAYAMAVMTGSEKVIPIHYDVYEADPQRFRQQCGIADVIVLRDGESTTI